MGGMRAASAALALLVTVACNNGGSGAGPDGAGEAQWAAVAAVAGNVTDLYVLDDTLYADAEGKILFTGNGTSWDTLRAPSGVNVASNYNYRKIGQVRYKYRYSTIGSQNGVMRWDMGTPGADFVLHWVTQRSYFETTAGGRLLLPGTSTLQVSTDNGLTLDTLFTSPESQGETGLMGVGPEDEIFVTLRKVSEGNGVYRSVDQGANFQKVLALDGVNENVQIGNAMAFSGNAYYSWFNGYLLKSPDKGATWTYSNVQNVIGNAFIASVASHDDRLYAAPAASDKLPRVYVSDDGGVTFAGYGEGLPTDAEGVVGFRDLLVFKGDLYLASDQGLYRRKP